MFHITYIQLHSNPFLNMQMTKVEHWSFYSWQKTQTQTTSNWDEVTKVRFEHPNESLQVRLGSASCPKNETKN